MPIGLYGLPVEENDGEGMSRRIAKLQVTPAMKQKTVAVYYTFCPFIKIKNEETCGNLLSPAAPIESVLTLPDHSKTTFSNKNG